MVSAAAYGGGDGLQAQHSEAVFFGFFSAMTPPPFPRWFELNWL